MKRINLDTCRIEGERLILLGPTFHRARNVLRINRGEWLVGTDGQGTEYTISVEKILADRIEGQIVKTSKGIGESPLKLTLAQCLPKGRKMDLVIQKSTELGVDRIVPLIGERSITRLDEPSAARRLKRWEKIAAEAVAQCGRTREPAISPPIHLAEFLVESAATLKIFLKERGAQFLSQLPSDRPKRVDIIVGPEGGLGPREEKDCIEAGFIPVSLGPRILRTETAGLVALTLLQFRWGDLA